MDVKERLIQVIEGLSDDEAVSLLKYAEELNQEIGSEPSDIEAFAESLEAIARDAPEEDVARIPTDFSENFDHYVYGTKKR